MPSAPSTPYRSTGLSKAYAALKGVSYPGHRAAEDRDGLGGMLSTIVGALIGSCRSVFAAPVSAVCLQISTICT